MPYASTKQRNYLRIHHKSLAKKWDKHYGGRIVKVPKKPKETKR